jgi:hypothetical protein
MNFHKTKVLETDGKRAASFFFVVETHLSKSFKLLER